MLTKGSKKELVIASIKETSLTGSQIDLMNMDGKLLKSKNVEYYLTSFSIFDYPSGIYLLQVTKNGVQKTYKVLNLL